MTNTFILARERSLVGQYVPMDFMRGKAGG